MRNFEPDLVQEKLVVAVTDIFIEGELRKNREWKASKWVEGLTLLLRSIQVF